MNVLILHDAIPPGAPPDEQDALVQARQVEACLRELGHSTRIAAFDAAMASRLLAGEDRPELVFNLVESYRSSGRLIHLAPAVLEAAGLRFTGAGSAAMLNTSGKLLGKQLLRSAAIDTPPAFVPGDPSWPFDDGVQPRTSASGERWIIKSVWEHASRGIDDASVVTAHEERDLVNAIDARRAALGEHAMAERFIEGREFNIALLAKPRVDDSGGRDPEVLPHAEIVFQDWPAAAPRIVNYRAKWDESAREYHATPRRFEFPSADASLLAALSRIAVRCWHATGLRGYARVDFRVDAGGRPWVLEVNANPCLSADAGFAAACGRAGYSQTGAVARIVDDATSLVVI